MPRCIDPETLLLCSYCGCSVPDKAIGLIVEGFKDPFCSCISSAIVELKSELTTDCGLMVNMTTIGMRIKMSGLLSVTQLMHLPAGKFAATVDAQVHSRKQ